MDYKTRQLLHSKAADVFVSASRQFQPEYVLLWIVDENGREIEHEFILMQEALAKVDLLGTNHADKQPEGKEVTV
jgi:hypothetical protein